MDELFDEAVVMHDVDWARQFLAALDETEGVSEDEPEEEEDVH